MNAAALSDIVRFYRARSWWRGACLGLAGVLAGTVAGAQTNGPIERPALGTTLTLDALADLPSGGNLFTLLDTVIPEVITDRVDTGGLSTGSASRIGARGSSWRQTLFRVDGIDITAGDGGGAPLLLPGVLAWERVDVATGLLPIDANAPGLAITLTPRRPTAQWTRIVEGLGAGPAIDRGRWPTPKAPSIARLKAAAAGSVLLSGPLVPDRVGVVVAGTWNGSSRYERADTDAVAGDRASVFTHFVYTPRERSGRDELRVVGWLQRASAPLATRLAFGEPTATETTLGAHGHGIWERRTAADRSWSVFAGYSVRQRQMDFTRSPSIVVERITDGPTEALIYPGSGIDTNWSLGLRLNRDRGRVIGVEVSGTGTKMRPAFAGRIGELVNGLPARVWEFEDRSTASRWRQTSFTAYVADEVQPHPRVTLGAGARFEHLSGSAEGGGRVRWNDVLPRASVRWQLTDAGQIAALAGYTRTTHRLSLSDLAWGDPSAPTGAVYRWNSSTPAIHAPLASERGALVARVGPGAGSTEGFSSIDPDLRRPHMDELSFGFESRPRPSLVIRLMGMGRRERSLLAVANVGVPRSAYAIIPTFDPGLFGDGQILPAFNRPTSTFGADRYLLTNPDDHEQTFAGAELTGQRETDRLFLQFGVTAGRSEGLAANRGFRTNENDAALLGEVFSNPNARTYAQGRLFTERGYTIKLTTVYRFPYDIRFGMAARYQDGQHFARLVVVPNLNQGPELVRAFRNGRTRFTFTGTLDVRVQKGFTSGRRRVAAVVEGYNVLNMGYEIEEFQVTGALSRATTAVQPPPALHFGIRIEF